MTENKAKKPINVKLIFSWVAIALAVISILVFFFTPAIVIDQSYAFNEQVQANNQQFIELKDWNYLVFGFAALFGVGTYDVYLCDFKNNPNALFKQTEKLAFNPFMLIGIILAIVAIGLYCTLILKKKKHPVLNKIIITLFIAAALMILLTAVWFYAINPIVESNYYDPITKNDTDYKYMNAHLSAGPIIATIGLFGSGVFAAIGEY